MSSRVIGVALTQTRNAYAPMPGTLEELSALSDRLEEIRAANVEHHLELMRAAQAQGARVIGFGELFPGPFFALSRHAMWLDLAEDAQGGPTVTTLQQAARDLSLIVVAPIYERAPNGKRFNTTVVIDEGGTLLGKYRKAHLPCGSNEQGSFDEPYYYGRSDGDNGRFDANVSKNPYFPVFRTSVGRIGVATCYDRHFEGVMYSLAKEGAELVFSPAVTFGAKSRRMWHIEFAADAARHNLFIAGSNRVGAEAPWNQPFFGESHIVGPNGVLENRSTHERLIISDVDLAELSRPDPSGWDLPRDVRYEIYSKRGP